MTGLVRNEDRSMAREGVERGVGYSPISARSTCNILLYYFSIEL
jgi:hypothetical protein